ncbi:uncharacterized protein LOC118281737 isoform X1 [Spodoptera frugiperda]|uniref:Uncharacterized protein LOC118281737 isoform X1 n=1 Tax=Spodoptera frugiperda TaxID=7108 RepID=A0A9R0ETD1_SPOFR|nr:uncharacterized protein LOC118281737 isoform X1 [Spodoptera frugiperda]
MASNTHHKIKSQCSVDSRHKMKDKHGHHAKKVPSKTKQKPQHRIQTEYSLGVRNIRTDDIITQDEVDCKCIKIIGHLESVDWKQYPRDYRPSPGQLALGDWTLNNFIWMNYVPKTDGAIVDDDVLLSKDTAYWDIEEAQRYFQAMLHCEEVILAFQYPYPRLPTPLGNYLWRANVATKLESNIYRAEVHCAIEITLKKMEVERAQMDRITISGCYVKLARLDYFRRKTFFRLLCNIISFQDDLQLVSFENLRCSRLEGVRLIQQLACFNAHTLKYLFLWRFVLPNENPILINYSYLTGSGQYIPRPDTRKCFIRSLGELTNLRVLALEYAHIADGTGVSLLSLLPVIKRPHFRLQLICREDSTPGRTDTSLGAGGYDIPDTVWRRVAVACPDIYLFMAFFCIRDYDHVRRFLTPSIPLREVHLQFGIDMNYAQRQDSDISCFVRHIAYRYGNNLVTFGIHQWRFAVFPLRRILESMPRIVRFFYVGKVEDEVDLKRLLNLIAYGVCKNLKQVQIQIQDDEDKSSYWKDVVESLTEEFADIVDLYNIKLCLSVYKS